MPRTGAGSAGVALVAEVGRPPPALRPEPRLEAVGVLLRRGVLTAAARRTGVLAVAVARRLVLLRLVVAGRALAGVGEAPRADVSDVAAAGAGVGLLEEAEAALDPAGEEGVAMGIAKGGDDGCGEVKLREGSAIGLPEINDPADGQIRKHVWVGTSPARR
jgi:hypothetical protein